MDTRTCGIGPLAIAVVLFCITPAVASAQPAIAWADLSATDREYSIARVDVADGETVVDNIGGLECRRNADPNDDFYMYFHIDDAFAYQGNRPNLFLTFHYWDGPGTTFWIQYDSTSDPYQNGPQFSTTGSNRWKTYTLGVKNAYFGNRQNNGADLRVAASPGATFWVDLVYVREIMPRFPTVLFNPTYHTDDQTAPQKFLDVCLNPGSWSAGIGQVDFFGTVDWQLMNGNTSQLSSCFNNIGNYGKRLILEVPALKGWCSTGQACFDATKPKIDHFISLAPGDWGWGRRITLMMDWPLHAAVGSQLNAGWEYGVVQTAQYMKLMRDEYPYIQILSIEGHPTFSAGDLAWWVQALGDESAAIGTPIIEGLVVDHDFNAGGSVSDMVWLKGQVNAVGPRFGVAFFGSGATNDQQYYTKVMAQGASYEANAAGLDMYWVTSWDPYPVGMLPESSPYTHTYTFIQFVWNHVWGR